MVHQVKLVDKALPAHRVPKVLLVRLVSKVDPVLKDLRAPSVRRAPLVQVVSQVQLVAMVSAVHPAKLVNRVKPVSLVTPVIKVTQDVPVKKDRRVPRVIPDHQVLLAIKVFPVPLVLLETMALLVHVAHKVH